MNEDDDNKTNYLKEYSKYSSLIFQMIAIAAVGVLGGIQLDKWLKMKSPVFTISLTIIMTIVAIIHLFKTLLKK
jgi:F0F1-type ATP synthase assembly protein I